MRSGRTSELRVAGATLYPTEFHCKVRAVSECVECVPRAPANLDAELPGYPAGRAPPCGVAGSEGWEGWRC